MQGRAEGCQMSKEAETTTRFVVVVLAVALVAAMAVLLHVMFAKDIPISRSRYWLLCWVSSSWSLP